MLISSIIAFVVMVCGGGILVKKLVQKPEANKYFDDIVELGIQPHRVNYMSHIFIFILLTFIPLIFFRRDSSTSTFIHCRKSHQFISISAVKSASRGILWDFVPRHQIFYSSAIVPSLARPQTYHGYTLETLWQSYSK